MQWKYHVLTIPPKSAWARGRQRVIILVLYAVQPLLNAFAYQSLVMYILSIMEDVKKNVLLLSFLNTQTPYALCYYLPENQKCFERNGRDDGSLDNNVSCMNHWVFLSFSNEISQTITTHSMLLIVVNKQTSLLHFDNSNYSSCLSQRTCQNRIMYDSIVSIQ